MLRRKERFGIRKRVLRIPKGSLGSDTALKRENLMMNMQEAAKFILGLRTAGWSEEKINNFILFIESGEEQYKPKPDQPKEKTEEYGFQNRKNNQSRGAL